MSSNIVEISDFTNQLKFRLKKYSRYPHVRFNPSIVHHKDDIFYGVYRLLVHYKADKKYDKFHPPPMWTHGWASHFDGTIFFILKIENNSYRIVKELPIFDLPLNNFVMDANLPYINSGIVDARIYKGKNNYFISYNYYINNPVNNPHFYNTKSNPVFKQASINSIAYSNLFIDPNLDICLLKDRHIPCFNLNTINKNKHIYPLSFRLAPSVPFVYEEKNWVFWKEKYITYTVEPHVVFEKNNDASCKQLIHQSSKNFISELQKRYKSLRFGLGAPPILFNSKEFIAIGHAKYDIRTDTILPIHHVHSKLIHRNISSHYIINDKVNPRMVYMMFFYTFERKPPFKLTRISHSFLPENNSLFTLTFPMGITKVKSNFIVSYGEGDKFCKLLKISSKTINKLLIPYINLKNLDDYKFLTNLP